MKIIISPAKKMNIDTDSLPWRTLPCFLSKTEKLLTALKSLSAEELRKLWKCSDSILNQNIRRLENMELYKNLTPAILSYEGIQYQYMAPGVFTANQLEYIEDNLRIISGFYGILKPFDGVTPYRLEMQSKLKTGQAKDLYQFWGSLIYESFESELNQDRERTIINLASKEYSKAITPWLQPNVKIVTCSFAESKDGKLVEKGTLCKMARGEMVRFMAENAVSTAKEIKEFSRLGYKFSKDNSDESNYVYVKIKEKADN